MNKNKEGNQNKNFDRELGDMFRELFPKDQEGILKMMEAMIRGQENMGRSGDGE